MYKVLYRKYRPSNFDEVVGQQNTIELIKDSVANNMTSHAYMFSGPRGTGKTSTAKILAKALNCTNPVNGNPCGECEQCVNFSFNQDIYEIDAASNNGIEQIREIVDSIKLLPINSKYKVFIIDEVHMLSTSAFNALLLTLEEPPSHVVFILATTNIESVPITVLSRCQRLDFRKIGVQDIIDNMINIAEKENICVEDDALLEIAEYSEGGMRDALGLLDQLSKLKEKITSEVVQNNLGLVSNKKIELLIDNLVLSNYEYVSAEIENYKNQSIDFKTIVKKIINSLKNKIKNYLTGSGDYIDISKTKKTCLDLADILNYTSTSINPYDLLEIILLENYTQNKESKKEVKINQVDLPEPKSKQESIEIKPLKADISNNSSDDHIIDIRVNNCFVNANKTYLSQGKENWSYFLNNVSTKKILGLIKDTKMVLCSDKYAILCSDFDEIAQEFNNSSLNVEKEYEKIVKKPLRLVCISKSRWNDEMTKFKDNLKNGIKYDYKEEVSSTTNNKIVDVFNIDVVEIK